MRIMGTAFRRGLSGAFAACALTGVAVGTVAPPTASAADPIARPADWPTTAERGAWPAAGSYLDAHPDANRCADRGRFAAEDEAKSNVQAYFLSHPRRVPGLEAAIAQPADRPAQPVRCLGDTRTAGGARRIASSRSTGEKSSATCGRSGLRTKL